MSNKITLHSNEIRDFYNEEISKKKTAAAKKGFLTRNLKVAREVLQDREDAYNNKKMLHGDHIFSWDVTNASNEVRIIQEIYQTIK